jgi:FkbM family methyltransferase
MNIQSVVGKLVQLRSCRPSLWRPFLSGWIHRRRNGFVPCVFPDCHQLLQVPLGDFYESYRFFCETSQGRRELDFFLNRLGKSEVFYDIGAFRGAFSFTVKLKQQDDVSIHIFEPIAKNVEAIGCIYQLNHFENCKINNFAVGESSLLAGAISDDGLVFQLTGAVPSAGETRFGAKPLDEYVAQGEPPPTIIKIDVDGFEMHVLRSARGCLVRHRPRLWLEVHPEFLKAQKNSADNVLNFLRDIGYGISFFEDFNSPHSNISYHVWCE